MSRSPIDVLSRTRMLRAIGPKWLEVLATIAVPMTFVRGQRIFTQGEDCPGMYCVSRGVVRVFKVAPSGKDYVLHFAEPGGTFAEVAVLAGFPCPANADALEDCECVLLPRDALQGLLQTHHELCMQMLVGMGLWVRQLVSLLEDIVLRDASGRVARHLLEADPTGGQSSFALRVLKKDLASHLNLTSETLSRTLRRFADSGLIELGDSGRLRLLDESALRSVADGILPTEFER